MCWPGVCAVRISEMDVLYNRRSATVKRTRRARFVTCHILLGALRAFFSKRPPIWRRWKKRYTAYVFAERYTTCAIYVTRVVLYIFTHRQPCIRPMSCIVTESHNLDSWQKSDE